MVAGKKHRDRAAKKCDALDRKWRGLLRRVRALDRRIVHLGGERDLLKADMGRVCAERRSHGFGVSKGDVVMVKTPSFSKRGARWRWGRVTDVGGDGDPHECPAVTVSLRRKDGGWGPEWTRGIDWVTAARWRKCGKVVCERDLEARWEREFRMGRL